MTTAWGPWEAFPSRATVDDDETARAHEPIRRALGRLLAEATPSGWTVVTGARCTSRNETVDVDVAVRQALTEAAECVPVLCVDIDAGGLEAQGLWRRTRLRSLAQMGVDHYWNLDTAAVAIEVWLRTGQEYRHAETLTGEDWLDYGIAIVRLDVTRLLEA